jgi:hypothetical protein
MERATDWDATPRIRPITAIHPMAEWAKRDRRVKRERRAIRNGSDMLKGQIAIKSGQRVVLFYEGLPSHSFMKIQKISGR